MTHIIHTQRNVASQCKNSNLMRLHEHVILLHSLSPLPPPIISSSLITFLNFSLCYAWFHDYLCHSFTKWDGRPVTGLLNFVVECDCRPNELAPQDEVLPAAQQRRALEKKAHKPYEGEWSSAQAAPPPSCEGNPFWCSRYVPVVTGMFRHVLFPYINIIWYRTTKWVPNCQIHFNCQIQKIVGNLW